MNNNLNLLARAILAAVIISAALIAAVFFLDDPSPPLAEGMDYHWK